MFCSKCNKKIGGPMEKGYIFYDYDCLYYYCERCLSFKMLGGNKLFLSPLSLAIKESIKTSNSI